MERSASSPIKLLLEAGIVCGFILAVVVTSRGEDTEPRDYRGRTLTQWREWIKSQPLDALGDTETIHGLMAIVGDPQAPWADRKQFALTLGRIGTPAIDAVPLFQDLLKNTEPDADSTQLWSLKALGLLGPDARVALPDVLPFVHDSRQSFLLRAAAMETLAHIGPDDPRTLTTLISMLRADQSGQESSQANELRRAAAEAIFLLGPAALPALPELLRALKSDWPLLQISAAAALGAIGPRGDLAVTPLADVVIFGESSQAREAAARALGAMGSPALPELKHLLHDQERLVRRLAVQGLQASSESAAVVKLLRPSLADHDPLIQVESAIAILAHENQDRKALETLLNGLTNVDRTVRISAYRTLRNHVAHLGRYREQLEKMESNDCLDSQSRLAARRLLGLME